MLRTYHVDLPCACMDWKPSQQGLQTGDDTHTNKLRSHTVCMAVHGLHLLFFLHADGPSPADRPSVVAAMQGQRPAQQQLQKQQHEQLNSTCDDKIVCCDRPSYVHTPSMVGFELSAEYDVSPVPCCATCCLRWELLAHGPAHKRRVLHQVQSAYTQTRCVLRAAAPTASLSRGWMHRCGLRIQAEHTY